MRARTSQPRPVKGGPSRTHRDGVFVSRRAAAKQPTEQEFAMARALVAAQTQVRTDASFAARMRGEHLRPAEDDVRSTLYRNRRLVAPHVIAWSVYAAAAALRGFAALFGADWLSTPWFCGSVAAIGLVGAVIAGLAVSKAWRGRALVAVVAAAGWLAWAAQAGLSWTTTAVFAASYFAVSARWWQHTRHANPDGPQKRQQKSRVTGPTRPDRDDVVGNWDWSIGCKSGPLDGSYLRDQEIIEHCEQYTVELVPGKHSLNKALSQLDMIASGLRRSPEEVILERHPSRDSSLLQLTVVTASPVQDTVEFTGPRVEWDGEDLWIEVGTYADGNGRAKVQMLARNSARHMMLFGGQGSGKTALMNLLALNLMSTGFVDVIYLDGQDGASSPELLKYADWPLTGRQGGKQLRRSLRAMFAARAKVLRAKRWAGWQTSPEYPALAVFIDECHLILDPNEQKAIQEWEELASTARKLGVSLIFATQHPGLPSLGNSDKLRSLLRQYTMIALRTVSKVAEGILRLEVDLEGLPELPGFGYVIGGEKEGIRSAPFRADYLDDTDGAADRWFEQYPPVGLDRATASAAGAPYLQRHERAEAEQRQIEDEVARLERGDDLDERFADDQDDKPEDHPTGGGGNGLIENAPRFPTAIPAPRQPEADHDSVDAASAGHADTDQTGLRVPAELADSQAAIYAAIARVSDSSADGHAKPSEIAAEAGMSLSRTYDLLTELTENGHLHKPARGRFAVVETADITN